MATVNGKGDEELEDDDDGRPTPVTVVKVPSKPPSMRPPSMRPLPPVAEEPKKPE